MRKSHEVDYLKELMRDFPVENPMPVANALEFLDHRYDAMYGNRNRLVERLEVLRDKQFIDDGFTYLFRLLPHRAHATLFEDILSNAGSYRQASEKNSGVVYFGRDSRFTGSEPEQITQEINYAIALLVPNNSDPVCSAAQFYQRFVQIHPFYDANGRIARLISSIYLAYHGLQIDWTHLKRNKKWLKRLNDCHKRYGTDRYNLYLGYLCSHWKKSSSTISDERVNYE